MFFKYMRFIFVDSFALKWNGYTSRVENGVSGSHNALLYLAEGIAKTHEVVLTSTENNIIEGEYLNVKYVNYNNLTVNCDYIVMTNNMHSLKILDKIHDYNKIIILTQNDLFAYERLFKIDKTKIIIGYISEFAKINILNTQPFLNDYKSILLYNSIDLNDLQHGIKKQQICYFACLERGYKMVTEIMKKIENYQFISNTYANVHSPNMSTSKQSILTHVSESKYFIYPLINLDNNSIHYDTFAYVVLEALLHGTIVIAPKIGVFEELYGDAVCYIDTDDLIPKEDLLYWKKHNSNFGYPLIDRYVEKVNMLDNNEELRSSFIQKGLDLKDKFENIKISNELLSYLKHMEEINLKKHLLSLSRENLIPHTHIQYLQNLKNNGFEPKVIYDIGSCALHWTKEAKKLWPDATYILFDAFSPVEFLYKGYDYHIGCLSDTNDNDVKFYQNDYLPGGNSYYREIGCDGKYFPEDKFVIKTTTTLERVVKKRKFPYPDFIKIDVQGSEVDIIKGGIDIIKNAKHLIVELQHTEYNKGALKSDVSLPLIEELINFKCIAPLFSNNGCDGDYGFINQST